MTDSEGTFNRVEATDEPMHGTRAMLVCGHTELEQHAIQLLLNQMELSDLPVVFVGDEDKDRTLSDLALRPHGSGLGAESSMERAIILSGITQRELYEIMPAYRSLELARPLWAVMTPTSAQWPVHVLIAELGAERQALRAATQQKPR